ncbi:MAG: PAS domain S-box protein [Myxococcota bacterium]|jgi:two-component system CheB/CheR fusion protein|nr:PAS domain S-box protein [Myxococcota bacterium]
MTQTDDFTCVEVSQSEAHKDPASIVPSQRCPIVGLGASAGGLEALKSFFAEVVPESGLAYVVVVHLSPHQPSMMPTLLQSMTRIPIATAEDGDVIEPNHVYVVPPNKELNVFQGKVQLLERLPKPYSMPIDAFLRSLAQDQGALAAAVILSGTGSDGTLGAREIKAKEGLVLVQTETSAAYGGMPSSVIGTGLVDLVLRPEEMPARLVHYFFQNRTLIVPETSPDANAGPERGAWMNKIYGILRSCLGHDFSAYKSNTIERRIGRRMGLHQIDDLETYARFLRESPEEVSALFHDLLIGVTSFFRDPDSFEVLRGVALPQLLGSMPDATTFRVWVPGCSTGEEVYSLAIVLREHLEATSSRVKLQLFGTDINKSAVERARKGIYPGSIAADMGEERLRKFFHRDGDAFRIREEIRDCAVFSPHDLLMDPPFSRLDLLCCRNVLIYFGAEAQRRLLPLFHHTLRDGGVLMLGSSETVGGFTSLFSPLNEKWKIFRKRDVPPALRPKVHFPSDTTMLEPLPRKPPITTAATQLEDAGQATRQTLLERFAPAAVLVDASGNMLHVHGRMGKYLEQHPGTPTLNIVELAREGLRGELSSALRQARTTKAPISRRQIVVQGGLIDLHVQRLEPSQNVADRYLVVFEDLETPEPRVDSTDAEAAAPDDSTARLAELQKKLLLARESHQNTTDELESSNQDLKSSIEELQSYNEELQSSNEELESSKEELHSLNEELQTVNAELQGKLEELATARDAIRSLLDGTQIATIFLDKEQRVRRFTPQANAVVHLISSDIGRPFTHLASNLEKPGNLGALVQTVLDSLVPKEKQVRTIDGAWYLMRILPYLTSEGIVDGTVLTFCDITDLKRTQERLLESQNRCHPAIELSSLVFAQTDRELRYTFVQSSRPDIDQRGMLGKRDDELADNEGNRQLMDLKRQVLQTERAARQEISFPSSDGWKTHEIAAEPLRDIAGQVIGVATCSSDLTPHVAAEAKLQALEDEYRLLFDAIDEGFCTLRVLFDAKERPVDCEFLGINPAFERQTGLENAVGRAMKDVAPEHADHWLSMFGHVALTGVARRMENPVTLLNRYYDVFAFRIGEPQERKVAVLFNDISARKKEEKSLRHLAVITRDTADAILAQDLQGRILSWNPAAERLYGWSEAEALAMNIRELVPRDRRDEVNTLAVQLQNGAALDSLDTERITKHGERLAIRMTATCLVDAVGKPYAIATVERAATPNPTLSRGT